MGEAKQKEVGVQGRVINFMGQRYTAIVFSAVLVLGSLVSLAVQGLKFGLDFTGGLQIETQFSEAADLNRVRQVLSDSGFQDAVVVNFGSAKDLKITTQQNRIDLIKAQLEQQIEGVFASNVEIQTVNNRDDERLPAGGMIIDFSAANAELKNSADEQFKTVGFDAYQVTDLTENNFSILTPDGIQVVTEKLLSETLAAATDGSVTVKRTEFVGPQVGGELRDQGGIGLLFALGIVMIYVALRFQFKFSVGAVAALAHDVIIVLGFFSIFQLDFDLTVLAAVLAVIGYSLNDTIVVSDRIRENFRKLRKGSPADVINQSLTQTLGRTLVTSLTTLLVLLALFFFGGELIHAFSIALIIGILIGTYSSVYVASNTLLFMNISKEDLMIPEKEGAEHEDMELP